MPRLIHCSVSYKGYGWDAECEPRITCFGAKRNRDTLLSFGYSWAPGGFPCQVDVCLSPTALRMLAKQLCKRANELDEYGIAEESAPAAEVTP